MTGQSAFDLELQGQQHQIQQHLQDALMTQTIRAMMGGAVPPPTRQPPTQNIRPVQYQMGPIANSLPSPGIQQFSMAQLQQMQHNASYMSNLAMSQHQPANQQQRSHPRQRNASKNSLDKVQKKSRKKNPKNSLGYKLAKLSLSDSVSPRSSVSSIASSTHTSVSKSSTLPPLNPLSTKTSVPESSINATVNPRNPLATQGWVAPLQNPYTGQSFQSYIQQRQLFLQGALQNNLQTISRLVPKYNPFSAVLNPLVPSCPNVLQSSKFTLPLTNNKFKE